MLKTYLQALLSRFYSKKESDVISNLSAPSNSSRMVFQGKTTSNWQRLFSEVAASDGFVYVQYKASTSNNAYYTISLGGDNTFIAVSTPICTNSGRYDDYLRVTKGQEYVISGHNLDEIRVFFLPSIGSELMGGVIQSLTRFFGQFKGACYA